MIPVDVPPRLLERERRRRSDDDLGDGQPVAASVCGLGRFYDENQPRDERGRWGSGGSDGGSTALPQMQRSKVPSEPQIAGGVIARGDRPVHKATDWKGAPTWMVETSDGNMVMLRNGDFTEDSAADAAEVRAILDGGLAESLVNGAADAYELDPRPGGPAQIEYHTGAGFAHRLDDQDVTSFTEGLEVARGAKAAVVNPLGERVIHVLPTNMVRPVDEGHFMPALTAHTDPPAAMLVHEYGHIRMFDQQEATPDAWAQVGGRLNALYGTNGPEGGSVYSRDNSHEAYAETYAEWHLTRGTTDNVAARRWAGEFGWRTFTDDEQRSLAAAAGPPPARRGGNWAIVDCVDDVGRPYSVILGDDPLARSAASILGLGAFYDEDQPRDERGRWGSGGDGAVPSDAKTPVEYIPFDGSAGIVDPVDPKGPEVVAFTANLAARGVTVEVLMRQGGPVSRQILVGVERSVASFDLDFPDVLRGAGVTMLVTDEIRNGAFGAMGLTRAQSWASDGTPRPQVEIDTSVVADQCAGAADRQAKDQEKGFAPFGIGEYQSDVAAQTKMTTDHELTHALHYVAAARGYIAEHGPQNVDGWWSRKIGELIRESVDGEALSEAWTVSFDKYKAAVGDATRNKWRVGEVEAALAKVPGDPSRYAMSNKTEWLAENYASMRSGGAHHPDTLQFTYDLYENATQRRMSVAAAARTGGRAAGLMEVHPYRAPGEAWPKGWGDEPQSAASAGARRFYDENQPRDENGRWGSGGADGGDGFKLPPVKRVSPAGLPILDGTVRSPTIDTGEVSTGADGRTVFYYQGDGYDFMNSNLRDRLPLDPSTVRLTREIDRHEVPEAVTVWRNVNPAKFPVEAGMRFTDRGFVSTDTDGVVAKNWRTGQRDLLAIRVPAGSAGVFVESKYHERELILQRGSTFEVRRQLGDVEYGEGQGAGSRSTRVWEVDLVGQRERGKDPRSFAFSWEDQERDDLGRWGDGDSGAAPSAMDAWQPVPKYGLPVIDGTTFDPYLRTVAGPEPEMGTPTGRAVAGYQGTGYKSINGILRYGEPPDADGVLLTALIDEHTVPKDVTVWRNVNLAKLDVKEGLRFRDEGFTSTDLAGGTVVDFGGESARDRAILAIRVPAGTRALSHETAYGEGELILQRGTEFEVVRSLGSGNEAGHPMFEVHVVGQRERGKDPKALAGGRLAFYDANQPRDENGRWGSGGGGATPQGLPILAGTEHAPVLDTGPLSTLRADTAVGNYQGYGYVRINGALRSGNFSKRVPEVVTLTREIDLHEIPRDVTVYRNVDTSRFPVGTGKTWTDRGFTSTDTDGRAALEFSHDPSTTGRPAALLAIRVEAGLRGVTAAKVLGQGDDVAGVERELILQRDSTFEVVGPLPAVTRSDGATLPVWEVNVIDQRPKGLDPRSYSQRRGSFTYDPDQPRDENGRWGSGGGKADGADVVEDAGYDKTEFGLPVLPGTVQIARPDTGRGGGFDAAIPEEARHAVEVYQGWSYRSINDGLRSGRIREPIFAKLTPPAEHMAILTAEIDNHSVATDLTVYRNVGSGLLTLTPGLRFTDKGFTSTDTEGRGAREFGYRKPDKRALMAIRVPAGSRGMNAPGSGENEMILQRGSTFEVKGRIGTVALDSKPGKTIPVWEVHLVAQRDKGRDPHEYTARKEALVAGKDEVVRLDPTLTDPPVEDGGAAERFGDWSDETVEIVRRGRKPAGRDRH